MRDLRDLAFTLPVLCAAYRAGVRPVDVMAEVYRRIEAAGDPGIFLHLTARDASLAAAEALGRIRPRAAALGHSVRRQGQHRRRRLPTTAACPAFAYRPNATRRGRAALAAGAIAVGKTNLDQFATGLVGVRTPYPAPAQRARPGARARRLVLGLGRCGGARSSSPSRSAPTPPGRAACPAALNNIVGLKPTFGALSTARRGAGLPHARLRLDLRSDGRRRLGGLQAAAGFDAADPYARRVAVAALGVAPPPLDDRHARARRSGSSATRRIGRLSRPRLQRCRRSARAWSRSISRRSTRWPRCSTRAPGWPSAMALRATPRERPRSGRIR